MSVLFFYLVKSDSSLSYWTSHVLQETRTTQPCVTGHPVGAHERSPWPGHVTSPDSCELIGAYPED